MSRHSFLFCFVIRMLMLAACGRATQASRRTPSIIIKSTPLSSATVQPTPQPTATPTQMATPTPVVHVEVTRAVSMRTGPGLEFAVIRMLRVKVDASQAAVLPINPESLTPTTSTPKPTAAPKSTAEPNPLAESVLTDSLLVRFAVMEPNGVQRAALRAHTMVA